MCVLMGGCDSKTDDIFSDARNKLNEDKVMEAFEVYSKGIKKYPNAPEGFNGLGKVYLRMGEPDKAFNAFEQAIRIAPNKADAFLGRGKILFSKKQYPEAFKDANRAIELENTNFEGFALRSKTLKELGNDKEALDDISHAISLSPDVMNLYLDRAYLYFYTFKMEGNAKDDLTRALKCHRVGDGAFGGAATTKALVHMLMASVYENSNEPLSALRSYTDAIESDPKFNLPYLFRGWLYEKFQKQKEADDDFAQAKKLEEDEAKTNPYMRKAK